ncbi:TolB family protein [Lysinibacillus sp. NPDC096418]|uniref:TolB family protein n=1 Tax=Lysinibacillus sp. NPDC096418 TaxID=3364138 RepID=UPI003818CC7C
MKRKYLGITVLTIACIMVAGCSLSGEANTQKTVTINDDVQLDSSLADSNLAIVHTSTIPVTEKADFKGFRDEHIYYTKNGAINTLHLPTQVESKLSDQEFFALSENGNRALSRIDDQMYVLDFTTKTEKLIEEGSEEYLYFADDEGKEIFYVEFRDEFKIHVINVDSSEVRTWDLTNIFKLDNFELNSIKKDEDGIYIVGDSIENGYGLYHLNNAGEIKTISNLTNIDSMYQFEFIDSTNIIFNDTYKGKTGIYLLNLESNEVTQFVAGGKDDEGVWTPFYKLSPDKSKILFDTPVQVGNDYKSNVYMAELVNNQLVNTVRIMENAELGAVIMLSGHWSQDSKTAYISTFKPCKTGNTFIDTVEIFTIQE